MNSGQFKCTKQLWCENALMVCYTIPVKHVQLNWFKQTKFWNTSNISLCEATVVDYSLLMSLFLSHCFGLLTHWVSLSPPHVKLLNLQICCFISLTSPSFQLPCFLSLHSSPHSTFSFIASPLLSPSFPSLPTLLISVAVGSLFKCSIGEELRFMQGQCGMW